jgi:hypothetical protein
MASLKPAALNAAAKPGAKTVDLFSRHELWPVWVIVSAIALLHMLTNARFGFYKDELQFLSESQNLNWGFVECPPLTPFIARISTRLFGLSLVGLRTFAVLAHAFVLLITAQMTKELGGKRPAIIAAVLSVGLSIFPIFNASVFEYTGFDYLWWVLIAYLIIRSQKSENPRWWLAIGAIEGVGLLTKYSIVFFIAGMICGLLFTDARRSFLNKWFWCGQGLALTIVLPNMLWLFRHGFISLDFLQSIHVRDIAIGGANNFLAEQLLSCINPFATPLFIAGIVGCMRSQRYRVIGWMYLTPLALFIFLRGRSYYLAPAYPMLIAMGAVICDQWIKSPLNTVKTVQRRNHAVKRMASASLQKRRCVGIVFLGGMALWGAWAFTIILPLQAKGPLRDMALRNSETLRDEFGWDNLVRTVAGIRDSLPTDQQAHLGIITRNYGEQGAIAVLGATYHLPQPISTINSAWLRGYPTPPPTRLIVVGFGSNEVSQLFTNCSFAAHNNNLDGVINDESKNHSNIFLCGQPRYPWPIFWKYSPHFE